MATASHLEDFPSHSNGVGQNIGTSMPSCDKFHDGAFEVLQPVESGHRSGMDALLLAASLPANSIGKIADLGAGAGVAGFAALNLHTSLQLVCVERNEEMVSLAERSATLATNAHFEERIQVLRADITTTGAERQAQGLEDNTYDYVIMNPPYNTPHYRKPANAMKSEAHMLGEGGLDAWFRTAAAILKPGGMLCLIYRTENIASVLACSQGRFGGLEILPIHSKQDEPAKRMLVRGTRASRAPLSLLPGLVLHEDDGQFKEELKAVFRGEALVDFHQS